MKAILLAAGIGSRISSNIGQIPKCLVDIGGISLIEHTINLLQRNHIEVTIITGYKHLMIEEKLKKYNINVFYNPFFRVTNSIGSLWYARGELNAHQVLIANADVYYTQELLDIIFSAKQSVYMLEDTSRADVGDYFFLSENGVLKKYGKELAPNERNSEYVGIACLRGAWVDKFRNTLCAMIENEEYDLWWENVLYSLVGHENIYTIDVQGVFWSEVDTISDYQRVLAYIENCRKDNNER